MHTFLKEDPKHQLRWVRIANNSLDLRRGKVHFHDSDLLELNSQVLRNLVDQLAEGNCQAGIDQRQ